jgi:hypothetical protein
LKQNGKKTLKMRWRGVLFSTRGSFDHFSIEMPMGLEGLEGPYIL